VRAMALRNDPVEAKAVVRDAAASLEPDITDAQITIKLEGSTATSCPTIGAGDTAVRLTVTYPMPFLTSFFGTGITLTGTGVMRCNG
jgi:hypothetical protein